VPGKYLAGKPFVAAGPHFHEETTTPPAAVAA